MSMKMCLVLPFWLGHGSIVVEGALITPRLLGCSGITCSPCWSWDGAVSLVHGTPGLQHWTDHWGWGCSVIDKLLEIPTKYKRLLLPSIAVLFVWFKVFFLVLNAANVLHKKCSNESLNSLFLSSVSWSLRILQFIYGLVHSSYYNILFWTASFCQQYEILIEWNVSFKNRWCSKNDFASK